MNKTTDDDVAFVKDHIQSFPKYRSHYSRATNPIQQYLHPDLSITKMYLLYKDVCSTQLFLTLFLFSSVSLFHLSLSRSSPHPSHLFFFLSNSPCQYPSPPVFLSLLTCCLPFPISRLHLLSQTARNLTLARSAIHSKFRLMQNRIKLLLRN